jgi:hypothetical protein
MADSSSRNLNLTFERLSADYSREPFLSEPFAGQLYPLD